MKKIDMIFGLLTVAICLPFLLLAVEGEISMEQSFLIAKDRAEDENKPYIVQFTDQLSAPSKWMEETVFQDADIIGKLNDEFIFVRLQVEEFEGFTLKQYYQVKSLPGFLFSPDHRLTSKTEGSLTRTRMLELMEKCLSGSNVTIKFQPDESVTTNKPLPRDVQTSTGLSGKMEPQASPTEPKTKDYASRSFRIQVGAFSSMDNARAKETELRDMVAEELRILSSNAGNAGQIHRLYLGNFPDRDKAVEFLLSWKAMGMDGIVKEVSLSEKI